MGISLWTSNLSETVYKIQFMVNGINKVINHWAHNKERVKEIDGMVLEGC